MPGNLMRIAIEVPASCNEVDVMAVSDRFRRQHDAGDQSWLDQLRDLVDAIARATSTIAHRRSSSRAWSAPCARPFRRGGALPLPRADRDPTTAMPPRMAAALFTQRHGRAGRADCEEFIAALVVVDADRARLRRAALCAGLDAAIAARSTLRDRIDRENRDALSARRAARGVPPTSQPAERAPSRATPAPPRLRRPVRR